MNRIVLVGMLCLWHSISFSQNLRNIELVVHRGGNQIAPENTLAAAEAAINMGADYLEIDVRKSADGIYYNMHDETIDRTTDGIGLFKEQKAEFINTLDAGSWFRHSFKGEKVPTVQELVSKYKDSSMKLYFDFKDGDVAEFVAKVKSWGITSQNSFFYFGNWDLAKEFVRLNSGLPLKINVGKEDDFEALIQEFKPAIIELTPQNVSKELVEKAHQKGIKVMGWIAQNQRGAYLDLLSYDIDMMNHDNPVLFDSLSNNPEYYAPPYLIAHRGGIVEDLYEEYDPRGIEEAARRGYKMMEVDVAETKDGVLFVHHDSDFKRIYGVDKKITELTWDEIKDFKSLRAGFSPMTFEKYTQLCDGRFDFMVDVKSKSKTPAYYAKLKAVLKKYKRMENLVFLETEARKYFWGEARFGVRVRELPEIWSRYQSGLEVSSNFFLFDHGNVLNASSIRLAQAMYMEVIPSVNIGHYKIEYHLTGAERDIKYDREMGITSFQIDSDYDKFFKK